MMDMALEYKVGLKLKFKMSHVPLSDKSLIMWLLCDVSVLYYYRICDCLSKNVHSSYNYKYLEIILK